MSFLSSNHAEYLTARITNEGRKAIAKGTFNIEFFQIGDSEFDYTSPFNTLSGTTSTVSGTTGQQKVFAPFDYESGVKYPYSLDSDKSTTYGTPISRNLTTTLRNEMGSGGLVSIYSNTPTVKTTSQSLTYSKLSIDDCHFFSYGIFKEKLISLSNGRPHHLPVLNIDSLWSSLFTSPPPSGYPFVAGCLFCVTKEQIKIRDISFYEKCLKITEEREQSPWEFERMMFYVFNRNVI